MLEADLTFAFDEALGAGRGLFAADLEALGPRLRAAHAAVHAAHAAGGLRWMDLPARVDLAREVEAYRQACPPFDDLLLLGIGGSALAGPLFGALAPRGPEGPRLHLVETVDPARLHHLFSTCRPERTLVLAVSKSGTTLETASALLLAEAWLERALGTQARGRLAVICDEEPNPLRARAQRRGYALFGVPPGVGGRFSALCAVGLLPAALLGLDPAEPLRGARQALERTASPGTEQNPALALAAVHALAQQRGRNVAVLFPYGEALRPLGPWWVQLVGESLGKVGPRGPVGVSPLAASGPADQHSLLQLLREGPDDKLTVFVGARRTVPAAHDLSVPSGGEELTPVAGKRLSEVLAAEQEATTFGLIRAGRPSATVTLDEAGPAAVGAFLLTLEMAVAYWGALLEVNAFDQPGVAFGKQAALARLLGAPAALVAELGAARARPRRLSR